MAVNLVYWMAVPKAATMVAVTADYSVVWSAQRLVAHLVAHLVEHWAAQMVALLVAQKEAHLAVPTEQTRAVSWAGT